MDAQTSSELNRIKNDFGSLINELKDIAFGIRKDFQGIGNDQCASCVENLINQCVAAKSKLENIDTNKLSPEFEERARQLAEEAKRKAAELEANRKNKKK